MGIIRKTMSVGTLGLVDFRSDKERTARYTRHTRNAVRAQSKMQAELAKQQAAAAAAHAQVQARYLPAPPQPMQQPVQTPPAGWYQHPSDQQGLARWWDGYQWTGATQPLQLR